MRPLICCAAALVLTLALAPVSPAADRPAAAKPRTLELTVGQTVRVQLTSKRPIRTVINENERIIRVAPLPSDPTTVLVTGLAPGQTRLILIDADGREESRSVGQPSGK